MKSEEIKRVKLRVLDPNSGEYKWSKKTKQCRIITLDNGEVIYKLLPNKIVSKEEILTEWEHGPTPTPKPSRKYTKEQLKSFGYSDEIIFVIHRGYNAKAVDSVCKRLDCTRKEAKELLDKYKYISKIPGCTTDEKGEIPPKSNKIQKKKGMEPGKVVMRKDIPSLKKSNRNQKRKANSKKLGRR